MVYFNTQLVRKLGHMNIFLELWAQLFQKNLGTRLLAIKLEETLGAAIYRKKPSHDWLKKDE